MSGKDKERIQTLTKAVEALPNHKKDVLLAYGEGMAAMAKKQSGDTEEK